LLEEAVYIGDRFQIGRDGSHGHGTADALLQAGLKFGRADVIKRFLASRRTGFYFAVVRGGMVRAGDAIELIGREQQEISVADITRVYAFERNDVEALRRAIEVEALPERLERVFSAQLDKQLS